MKAIVMREVGTPSVLRIEDVPMPEINDQEVLVRVEAVGVAYHDVVQRNGAMRRFTELPMVLGYEIAGIVEAVGARVRTLEPGMRICTKAFHSCGLCRLCRTGMETSCLDRRPVHGGYAEYVALAEEVCAKVPDGLPPENACMLGATAGVALNALRDVGRVRLGETVLITGASGGVGLSAVEIAHISGGTVIALTRSKAKAEALRAAGADTVIVIDEGGDFSQSVKDTTQGRGVDIVIDTVGSRVFTPSFKSLALGGRYVMVGQLFREEIKINPAFIFFQRAQILGVGSVRRDQLEDVVALAATGRIHPSVAEILPLAQAAQAHERVERGEVVGRIVLRP